jgi:hypothetical protein
VFDVRTRSLARQLTPSLACCLARQINPRAGFDVAILGANKQVLRARLPNLRSSDLGIQFAKTTTGAWDEEQKEQKESRNP